MGKRPTIGDVAKAAKVSLSTVSYAFSGARPIGESVRRRVFESAERLGYRPYLPAKKLGGGSTGAVGIVASYFGNPATGELLDALVAALQERSMKALVSGVGENVEDARRMLSYMSSGLVDGAINMYSKIGVAEAKALCGSTPCVTFMRPHPESPVYVDFQRGAECLLEHLWSLGHRRIGLIWDPGSRPPELGEEMKCASYRQFMSSKGERPRKELMLESDSSFESGFKLGGILASRGATAIFAPCDRVAMGALAWAASEGVEVPKKLSVVSCDNTRLAAASNPPLTCASLPIAELAEGTASGLLRLIEGASPSPQRIVSPSLVIRNSTAPAVS